MTNTRYLFGHPCVWITSCYTSLSVWVTSRFTSFSVWITSCFHIAKNRSMGGGQEMPMTAVVKLNPPCMAFDDIVRVWFYRHWWTTCSEHMRLLVSVLLSLRLMDLTRWVVSAQLLISDLFLFFLLCLSVVRGTKPCRYHTLKYKPIRILKKKFTKYLYSHWVGLISQTQISEICSRVQSLKWFSMFVLVDEEISFEQFAATGLSHTAGYDFTSIKRRRGAS